MSETNEDLRQRLERAEAILAGLKDEQVDAVVGRSGVSVLRLRDLEQQLSESEERFRVMADGSPLMIWVTNPEGGLEFVNRAYLEFFGCALDDVKGFKWRPLVHPEDAEAFSAKFGSSLRDHAPFWTQVRVRRADGTWRWIESYGAPRFLADGTFVGMVGGSPDITDRKDTEAALVELTENLERLVAERTAESEARAAQLQRLALELSKAEDQERERIAGLLHDDLQQHLAALRFRLGSLMPKDHADEKTKKKFRHYAQLLDEAIAKSRSLSHDLSPPTLRQNGLLAGLHWLRDDFRAKHGLEIVVRASQEINPESPVLSSIVFRAAKELLFNCQKHAGAATVELDAFREDEELVVCVRDDGRGFDPEEIRKRRDPGAGLGLFAIEERLDFLGGRMEIETAPGKGCRVTLRFPLRAERAPEALTEAAEGDAETVSGRKDPMRDEATAGKPLRVLLADDHDVMREGLATLLQDTPGFDVVAQAGDGFDAVRLARKLEPDVVLMDLAMPDMDGIEATAEILKTHPHIRVIGLSMYDDPDAAQKMFEAGASAYLCKSDSADDIMDAIRGVGDEG